MSALVAGSVTYTLVKKTVGEGGYRKFVMTLAFGDGALTYPTGGLPLVSGNLGCPNQIIKLVIFGPSSADGIEYKYDAANNKIRMYQMPIHTHDLLLKNAAVADSAGARVNAGANLLGANTGSDITVTGAGANGGVKNSVQAAFGELATSAAPAATTLYVEVEGW